MENKYSKFKTFADEGLVKYYDDKGRILEIAFLRSGNGCTITYVEPSEPAHANERIVHWSTGHRYRTWEESGNTKFIQEASSTTHGLKTREFETVSNVNC